MTLRLPDSGAETSPDGRRHAPSAARNAAPILAMLRTELPPQGRLLEIAAGTGQHAAEFSAALPQIDWQPTDVNPDNLASITAWRATAGPNLRAPVVLDATRPDWSADWPNQDAILIVNLLHLIPAPAVETLLDQAARALSPSGVLLIYGPFLRDGLATSDGDAAFHASLQAQDPAIGYKDLASVTARLASYGLTTTAQPMPANNLMLVARR
ncbi:MAG: methyltransferase [Rhodobacterales bacterium RIFCSPHIGHO2_02_FULL_62_130]|nr:MAG: methyltransferase [Rhodobacterales bacterium RIFCSPHIGHO2_02_FULL_62_130]OHC56021.1 MAG: methyltransferase [Rhodobacterales bacterium RIFCSPHIGHO2_12_FULL_62_75]HCY99867.1 methyltransferase [Rhodobacter sp.]